MMARNLVIAIGCVTVMLSLAAYSADFKVTSTDVAADRPTASTFVLNGFGCSGENLSPALSWSGAPVTTQSFALSIYDPDAPTGSGWWHWYVVNIPATTNSLARGAGKADGSMLPKGAAQISTDFGAPGYGGPCPPQGDKPHRYIVTVYALKLPKLDLPANATAAMAGFNVKANALAEASLTFKYGR